MSLHHTILQHEDVFECIGKLDAAIDVLVLARARSRCLPLDIQKRLTALIKETSDIRAAYGKRAVELRDQIGSLYGQVCS